MAPSSCGPPPRADRILVNELGLAGVHINYHAEVCPRVYYMHRADGSADGGGESGLAARGARHFRIEKNAPAASQKQRAAEHADTKTSRQMLDAASLTPHAASSIEWRRRRAQGRGRTPHRRRRSSGCSDNHGGSVETARGPRRARSASPSASRSLTSQFQAPILAPFPAAISQAAARARRQLGDNGGSELASRQEGSVEALPPTRSKVAATVERPVTRDDYGV